jgi:hypothetical protein
MERPVLGLVEDVSFDGRRVKARIDTGATTSSVDIGLAESWESKHIGEIKVKSSHGISKLKLIGQDILKQGFLIDPSK